VLAPSPWSTTATQTVYSYAYDGLALRQVRAESEAASATLSYLYGSGDVPYAGSYEATASGATTSTVFQLLSTDHGDVVALADEAGEVFARYTYGPFGEAEGTVTRGTSLIPVETAAAIAQANPLRYAGYCFDTWSGDYYLQARYYDPATRQFLSKDPAEADGEESAYQYCGGDPVQSVDPTGEMADYTGSGRITVANSYANAARQAANKRQRLVLQARAEAAERAERAHRVYVQKLANARIARQKATAAKLRIAKAAAAKKQRVANLKAQTAASQREAARWAAAAERWEVARQAAIIIAIVDAAVGATVLVVAGPALAAEMIAGGYGGLVPGSGIALTLGKKVTEKPACFPAGTPVRTATGLVAIERVCIGDLVLSRDERTGETSLKRVMRTMVHRTEELVHVRIADDIITATVDHPFRVAGRGWVAAGELAAGDTLYLADGGRASIVSIVREQLASPVDVYNLEVEDFHTYFVASTGIWVHNECGGGGWWETSAKSYKEDPGSWELVSGHAEEATGKAAQGGVSVQEVFEKSGERVVRHTLYRASGSQLDTHLRPNAK